MSVHVYPSADLVEHDTESLECVCGPDLEYVDPKTGSTYPSGPLVVHHSLDGREERE